MKKKITLLITLVLILILVGPTVLAENWPQHARDERNNAIVDAKTPLNEEQARLVFDLALADEESHDAISNILIVEDRLWAASGSRLYKIDRQQGTILDEITLEAPVASFTPFITYGDGLIFLYGHDGVGGQVLAYDAQSLDLAWQSEWLEGLESFSPLVYADSWLYAPLSGYDYEAFTLQPGVLLGFDLSEEQGEKVKPAFRFEDEVASFYWNAPAVTETMLYVGTDEGRLLGLDRREGTLLDELEVSASVKSGLSAVQDRLFFGTESGVGSVFLQSDGTFDADSLQHVDLGAQVTTTPVVSQGRVYVGSGDFSGGTGFHVLDKEPLQDVYAVTTPGIDGWSEEEIPVAGIQANPVVSTGHEGKAAVYYVINAVPSSLICLVDHDQADIGEQETLFVPPAAQQNSAMTALSVAADGTVYYANDAGILFAVAGPAEDEKDASWLQRPAFWGLILLIVVLGMAYGIHRHRKNGAGEEQ